MTILANILLTRVNNIVIIISISCTKGNYLPSREMQLGQLRQFPCRKAI